MKQNNREYGFVIMPNYDKVFAEIYQISEPLISLKKNNKTHIHLISKKFGKWYRKPNKKDYKKARTWAEEQMSLIFNANEEIK